MTHYTGKAIMLDMEFLDTKPSAAILSIGAVEIDFWPMTIGKTFYRELSVADCLRHGMTIGVDTLQFWLQDADELKRLLVDGKAHLGPTIDEFFSFVREVQSRQDTETQEIEMWACGALDFAIIEFAVEQLKSRDIPWKYHRVKDFRTLRDEVDIPCEYQGVIHNGLDDAINQANHLIAIRKRLNEALNPVHKTLISDQLSGLARMIDNDELGHATGSLNIARSANGKLVVESDLQFDLTCDAKISIANTGETTLFEQDIAQTNCVCYPDEKDAHLRKCNECPR